ncbi:unnamed protein product, partial [Iphiclides podalirius]
METKSGVGIQDHWMKSVMEPAGSEKQMQIDNRSVKREKMAEQYNGADNNVTYEMKQQQNDTRYRCDVCDLTFEEMEYLILHKKFHGNDKDTPPMEPEAPPVKEGPKKRRKFKCDLCDVKVNSQYHLDIHRSKHEVDDDVKRPHKCSTCGKSFIVKINLNLHIRVCHPDLAEPEDEDDDVMTDNS